MSVKRIRWLALSAILVVLLAGYFASVRSVMIISNGERIELSTRAFTVRGALQAAEIKPGPDDSVSPALFSLLRSGTVITLNRAATFQVLVDGQYYWLSSSKQDPNEVITELGLSLSEGDRILSMGRTLDLKASLPYSPTHYWEIRRSVAFTFEEGGSETRLKSSAPTIAEALQENGIIVYEGDRLLPEGESLLSTGLAVHLKRGAPIEIQIGDEVIHVRNTAETVGDVLAEAGIALLGLDRSEPEENETISELRSIRVIRVREQVELQTESIPYTVEWQPDPNTEIDERSILQAGQQGVNAKSERVRYEDGMEVGRVEEGEWMMLEAKAQISGYGTKIVTRTAVVDGVSIEYWRTLELFATSYSPCRSGTEKCYYYTALGDEVKKGIAAVYKSWWDAMGQHTVFVPGYGPAKISDNGAYPDGRPWIDLAYSDEDWVTWGDWVTVYFTTPIPPEHEILYILP